MNELEKKLDIPVNARVECRDGLCGHCIDVIVDPKTDQVTFIVVRESRDPNTERLVPIDQVAESQADLIRLNCTSQELVAMKDYMRQQDVRVSVPPAYLPGEYPLSPIYYSDTMMVKLKEENVPQGQVTLHSGARARAVDGAVGQIDEFLVNPKNGRIAYLIVRVGHFWNKRDVVIPVSEIDHIAQDSVYLKLNKLFINALPTVSIHRGF